MDPVTDLRTVERFRAQYPRLALSVGIHDEAWTSMITQLQTWAKNIQEKQASMHAAFLVSCVGQTVSVYENTRARKGEIVSVETVTDRVVIRMPEGDEHTCTWCSDHYSHVDEDFDNSTQYTLAWYHQDSPMYRTFCQSFQ